MKRVATVTAGPAIGLVLALTAMGGTAAGATAGAAAGRPVPDFTGKGLMTVFTTLDHRTKVEVYDASGYGRTVLWPSNWKVCSQHPAPGTDLGGRTFSVDVMKKGEKCPRRPETTRNAGRSGGPREALGPEGSPGPKDSRGPKDTRDREETRDREDAWDRRDVRDRPDTRDRENARDRGERVPQEGAVSPHVPPGAPNPTT
ncbi:hypothetical protein ACF068_11755 [Streptomyces sp. NPDC016309]|uniref:hypothetical protein n=1 Tax=Streptomyces sp. NPDC016309 TaxID=3364965 RepID=UPI0036FC1AA8